MAAVLHLHLQWDRGAAHCSGRCVYICNPVSRCVDIFPLFHRQNIILCPMSCVAHVEEFQ